MFWVFFISELNHDSCVFTGFYLSQLLHFQYEIETFASTGLMKYETVEWRKHIEDLPVTM